MMRQVVRFWVIVLSLLASIACVGYLLLTFWFPDAVLVATRRDVRLGVTIVAVVSIGLFTWAAAVLSEPEVETTPDQEGP
jgi:hypothetical protein